MSNIDRRLLLAASAIGAFSAPVLAKAGKNAGFTPLLGPRSRLIFVNDLCGDIDGLFATVHAILSHSIDLRGIIGTATFSPYFKDETAVRSAELAQEMLRLMGRAGKVPVHAGSDTRLPDQKTPTRSAGAEAIIAEAMRDSPLPLYVAVGGGLNEVASALLIAPEIANRFTLIWIGGDWREKQQDMLETNFGIDPLAAMHVLNHSTLPVWQIPRDVYATCLVSASELQAYVAPHGKVGPWLMSKIAEQGEKVQRMLNTGETWTLGDNPLVVLAALNDWVPSGREGVRFTYQRTGSSQYEEIIPPLLSTDGSFKLLTEGRKIRHYRSVDVRMMLGDMFAKLRLAFPAK